MRSRVIVLCAVVVAVVLSVGDAASLSSGRTRGGLRAKQQTLAAMQAKMLDAETMAQASQLETSGYFDDLVKDALLGTSGTLASLSHLLSVKAALNKVGTAALTHARTATGAYPSPVRFIVRGFISSAMTGNEARWLKCTKGKHAGKKFYVGQLPTAADINGNECFTTDSRRWSKAWTASSRIKTQLAFDSITTDAQPTQAIHRCDRSRNLVCKTGTLRWGHLCEETCSAVCDPYRVKAKAWCLPTGSSTKYVSCTGVSKPAAILMLMYGHASDPCTPPLSPNVDYWSVSSIVPQAKRVHTFTVVDSYPYFEIVARIGSTNQYIAKIPPKHTAPGFHLYGSATNKHEVIKSL